jgi:peptidyl-prolyl cis-trans isomerase D
LVRKHADSWLIKSILWSIVLAFVGTIFYSWGMGGATRSKGNVVAKVEGRNINLNEYEQTFNNLVEFYRNQFKAQFSEDMIRRLDLKTAALDAIIQKKLLINEAEKLKLTVTDDELADRIKNISVFQRNTQFDPGIYKQFLKMRRLSALEFEESQRDALLIDKVQALIKQNVKVSKKEILEAFEREEDKVKIDYVLMDEDHFKDTSPAKDEDLTAYYDLHKKEFEVPEQIQVEYIKLAARDFEKDMEAADDEIKEQYDLKKADFRVPRTFKASHILHRLDLPPFDGKASDESREKQMKQAEDAARKKAEETLKRIRNGEKFETLARQLSDDKNSGAQGGSLGSFQKGVMVPQFEAGLEKLAPGAIGEPVLTPFGFHIIRLEEVQEERIRPLAEIKETLVRSLKENKAKRKVKRAVKTIQEAASKNQDLAGATKAQGAETKLSSFISRADHTIPDIGIVPEFFNAVFSLSDNQVSEPVNTDEASYVMKVVARKTPYIPELSEIKEKIALAVRSQKNISFTAHRVKEMEKNLTETKNIEKIAQTHGLTVSHSPLFGIEDSIPGLGNLQPVKEKSFSLKKDEVGSVSFRNKIYLLKVTDRVAAGEIPKDKEKEIYARLQKEKGDLFFQDWLKTLREKAEITIDRTQL